MKRLFFLLAALFVAGPATAGLRATYAAEHSRPLVVEIADNGDFRAELSPGRRLIVRGDEAYLIEDRLTGPAVMRLDDFLAVAPRRPQESRDGAPPEIQLTQRGVATVNGRTGRAYFAPAFEFDPPARERGPALVISEDPALAPLAAAMRRIALAELELDRIRYGSSLDPAPQLAVLREGAPLLFFDRELRAVEATDIPPASFALPAEPESRAALAARLADEAREDGENRSVPISRAVFGAGRLWLLTDTDDALFSLAEGDASRRVEDLGEPVLDICASGGTVTAITGARDGGSAWPVRRLDGGNWRLVRSVRRDGDTLLALSCGPAGQFLLTSKRLVDLVAPGAAPLRLSEELRGALVTTVLHLTPAAAFAGFNAGEWGGGMVRIDRRTGRVTTIERNATGELCAGPLNTQCDPVNGIATIPWRPDCVAAAVGLIHMMAHGRIVQVCGDRVEQLAAVADVDSLDPDDAEDVADAAAGGYGAVAFFGLAASGDALIGVGHNGLYRIDAQGRATRQNWPRFIEVDGVYVSFALPGVVLVLTQINGRASLSGSTPLLAIR